MRTLRKLLRTSLAWRAAAAELTLPAGMPVDDHSLSTTRITMPSLPPNARPVGFDRLALQDVPTRVAWAVLQHARNADALRPGGRFRLPRTQEELASELGTTREGVSRALRMLREIEAIVQRGPFIQILDPVGLERQAGESTVRAGALVEF